MEDLVHEDAQACPKKRRIRSTIRRVEEEVYNLSSPAARTHQPITFTNDDLRVLHHLPHDDALVVSTTIFNFNV